MSLLEKVREVGECYECKCTRKSMDYPGGFALEQAMSCDTCLSLIISAIREEVIEEAAKVADKYLGAHAARIAMEIRDLMRKEG